MKFSFRFANLLGSVYKKGNLTFSPDGNSIFSPVGNRITIFDLKNNKSETLPIESKLDITCVALSPDGYTMILVNEGGEAMLCSLISKSVLHYYNFCRPVHRIKFSPDGRKFAVAKEDKVLLFHTPGKTREYNPFVLQRTFYGAYDDNTCIDWSTDSQAFCAGSKDMSTRVYAAEIFSNFVVYTLGGHNDTIVEAFFEQDSLNVYTLSENGMLNVWVCDTQLDGLKLRDEESDEEVLLEEEVGEKSRTQKSREMAKQESAGEKTKGMINYSRTAKHNIKKSREEGSEAYYSKLTAAAYHKATHILVTGFQDGTFLLHDLPDFSLISSLNISEHPIEAIAFNKSGDWLGFGCSRIGQLLVWEWQSETYVMKQQGHFSSMTSLAYSPDGQYIATGGEDAKVKVWNTISGFCFVTFNEHLSGVTAVVFSQRGQVVMSSSLDGTVRAFDLKRYRNFRTFTSPRPVQFSCLAVDPSGEAVCAGGLDTFEIYMWSVQTGRLLEVLAGHEGPVSDLSFSPSQPLLSSASWDKTIKMWAVFGEQGTRESLLFPTNVLAVAFSPAGSELAAATLDAEISFWNTDTASQVGSIKGRHDLGYFRKETDKITAKQSSSNKTFTTLCYTADGRCLLAAGATKNVCIYSVPDQLLIKKFEISCNFSLDGMQEFLDRRKMTEWGSLAMFDHSEDTTISLPGVRKGDMSSRHWKPQVQVSCVRFSPTGRAWAATSTEGLLIYSLDHSLVFDPFELEIDITPANVRKTLDQQQYSAALMLSFRLNEQNLIQEVIESIPTKDIELICQSLPNVYVDKLLHFMAPQMETSAHLEFYLLWLQTLLLLHGAGLKQRCQSVIATLRNLQKNISRKFEDLSKVCDHNKYMMQYVLSLSQAKRKRLPDLSNPESFHSESLTEPTIKFTDGNP